MAPLPGNQDTNGLRAISARFSRRDFLRAATAAGLSLTGLEALSGCGPALSTSTSDGLTLETTRIGLVDTPAICISPMYAAEDLLKGEGFTTIEYVKDSLGPVKAVAAGRADMSVTFSGPLIYQLAAGDPIVILAGVHSGCFVLFGTPGVRAVSDLKGKTVAVTQLGSSQHVFLSAMLSYVGVDPRQDVNWVTHPSAEAIALLAAGKIDAYMAFPPEPQELRDKHIGIEIVNSILDKPWSQYFCCMVAANRDFVRKNPIATKRALRAILKGVELCASEPERVAQSLVDKGFTPRYDYALQTLKDIPYRRWRELDPEDSLRFWSLRLFDGGLITTDPQTLIAQNTDWRFLNELKKELKA